MGKQPKPDVKAVWVSRGLAEGVVLPPPGQGQRVVDLIKLGQQSLQYQRLRSQPWPSITAINNPYLSEERRQKMLAEQEYERHLAEDDEIPL